MAFPPEDLCITLPDIPTADKICLRGGLCLEYIWDGIGKIPHVADVPLAFFGQIGPAMAPLKPFFNLLETVLSIFNCVKAIPDAITSLNPSELLQCIPAMAKAVDQVLKLIPQLSIPKMVIALIKNLATLLRGVASDLSYIQSQFDRIGDMIDRAADLNDHKLNGFLVCAQEDLATTNLSTAEALRGVGSIVLLVNVFMSLFGGPEIPCFGELMSSNLSAGTDVVIDLLTGLASLLTDIANSIPDPDLVLTLALGDQKC